MIKQYVIDKIIFIIPCICIFLHWQNILSEPVISIFFKPGPDLARYTQKIKKPGKLAKYSLQGIRDSEYTSGIIAMYAGYISASDKNGQLLFLRKQESDDLSIIITTQITPIVRFEQTIDHFELIRGIPTAMFNVSKTSPLDKGEYYWNIQPAEAPSDNTIPYASIVIFAKPHDIQINTGTFKTTDGNNIILPPFFVQKKINIIKNALYTLQIRHLFSNTKPVQLREAKHSRILLTE